MIGIYKIENKVNGKVYIGQAENIFRRWSEHEGSLVRRDHHSHKLQNAFDSCGQDIMNFEFSILEVCTKEELDEKEVKYMKEYNSIIDGYNVRDDVGMTKKAHEEFKPEFNKLSEEIKEIKWCNVSVEMGKNTNKFLMGKYDCTTYGRYLNIIRFIHSSGMFLDGERITIERCNGVSLCKIFYKDGSIDFVEYRNRTVYVDKKRLTETKYGFNGDRIGYEYETISRSSYKNY